MTDGGLYQAGKNFAGRCSADGSSRSRRIDASAGFPAGDPPHLARARTAARKRGALLVGDVVGERGAECDEVRARSCAAFLTSTRASGPMRLASSTSTKWRSSSRNGGGGVPARAWTGAVGACAAEAGAHCRSRRRRMRGRSGGRRRRGSWRSLGSHRSVSRCRSDDGSCAFGRLADLRGDRGPGRAPRRPGSAPRALSPSSCAGRGRPPRRASARRRAGRAAARVRCMDITRAPDVPL